MAGWILTVDIKYLWQDASLSFEQLRDGVCKTLRDSDWLELAAYPEALDTVIRWLELSVDEKDFNYSLNALYDHADNDCVWIRTF